jgi:hypothetical protein
VTVDGARDYTFTGEGTLVGHGTLVKSGTGTLTLDGPALTGQDIVVSNGTLKLGANLPVNGLGNSGTNGNVVVAGYYTEATTNTATNSNGYYFYTFDTGSDNFSDVRNFKFNEGYVEKAAWARFSNILGNQQYSIKAGNIFELENGSVVLCGEHRFVKAIYDPNMKSWSYQMLTKNILVSTLQPDGSAKFTMVEKQQSAGSSVNPGEKSWINHFISYSAFAHHNDLYFLFTDDHRNVPYPGQGVVCGISGLKFKGDKWADVMMRLTPDQKLTQRVFPETKQLLRYVDFTDGDNFYASGIRGGEVYMTKYAIEE